MKKFAKVTAMVAALAIVGACVATPACAQTSIRSEARQLRDLARQIGVNTNGVNDRQLVQGFQEFAGRFGIQTAAQARNLLRVAPQSVINTVAAELQQKVNEARAENQSRRINTRNVKNQRVVQQPQVIVVRERNNGIAQALNNGVNVAGSVLAQVIQARAQAALLDRLSDGRGSRFLRNVLIFQALQGGRGLGGLRFRSFRFGF